MKKKFMCLVVALAAIFTASLLTTQAYAAEFYIKSIAYGVATMTNHLDGSVTVYTSRTVYHNGSVVYYNSLSFEPMSIEAWDEINARRARLVVEEWRETEETWNFLNTLYALDSTIATRSTCVPEAEAVAWSVDFPEMVTATYLSEAEIVPASEFLITLSNEFSMRHIGLYRRGTLVRNYESVHYATTTTWGSVGILGPGRMQMIYGWYDIFHHVPSAGRVTGVTSYWAGGSTYLNYRITTRHSWLTAITSDFTQTNTFLNFRNPLG
jgi:hypothetical protein